MNGDMNATLQKLKDIRPPVEVPDYSLWLFLAIVALLLMIVASIAYWLYKRRARRPILRRRRKDPMQIAKEMLEHIDFHDAKSAVYAFDEYLPVLIGDDVDKRQRFEAIKKRLERYKYKKEVPPLSIEDEEAMRRLIREVL